jgi:hypothetical protein
MASIKSGFRSQLYLEFQDLASDSFREQVRFFESKESSIRQLSLEEFFELLAAYTTALFETGQYSKFLLRADELIELSMEHNLHEYNGCDVFLHTLYQKAYAYYYRIEYKACEHVLTELVRINPSEVLYKKLLRRCLLARTPRYVQHTRAVVILLLFLSAGVTAVELLVFRSFYPQWVAFTELFRTSLFLAAVALLVLSSALFQYQVSRQIKSLT